MNAELQVALIDLQMITLDFEALQESLVRLGIVDPDDQKYPQAFCVAPFLKVSLRGSQHEYQLKRRTGA